MKEKLNWNLHNVHLASEAPKVKSLASTPISIANVHTQQYIYYKTL